LHLGVRGVNEQENKENIDPLKGHWGASQLLSEDDLQDSLPVYLLARAARQWVCKPN